MVDWLNDLNSADLNDVVRLLKAAQQPGAQVGLLQVLLAQPYGAVAAVWTGCTEAEAVQKITDELND